MCVQNLEGKTVFPKFKMFQSIFATCKKETVLLFCSEKQRVIAQGDIATDISI